MIPPQAVLGEETSAKLIGVVACHIKKQASRAAKQSLLTSIVVASEKLSDATDCSINAGNSALGQVDWRETNGEKLELLNGSSTPLTVCFR